MGRVKYEPPTSTFPYKIPKRLNLLSAPRKYFVESGEDLPPVTELSRTRKSAISGHVMDRNSDIAWPFLNQERLERLDRMIEAANATIYTKLADCVIDLKKQDKDFRKKKGWSDTEWKRHMEHIGPLAMTKKEYQPPPVDRGKRKPLEELLPRLTELAEMPDFKCYKRLSQEAWYRNPEKVSPKTQLYEITERIKKLAVARAIHHDHYD